MSRAGRDEDSIEGATRGFEAVAVSDVVQRVVERLSLERRIRVRLRLEGEGLVRGDETLLATLLANAIDNALKFSGDECVEVALVDEQMRDPTGAGPGPFRVRVEIRDRGIGVPSELRQRVFEPFFRARADASPGHGLGLSLIAHIARFHGGEVALLDAAVGTTLRVDLPSWSAQPPSGSA